MLIPEIRVRLEPEGQGPTRAWPAPPRAGGRVRRETIGPVFLLALLAAAFVPSVLSEFDVAGALKLLAAAFASLTSNGPALSSGDAGSSAAQQTLRSVDQQSSGSQDLRWAAFAVSLLALARLALPRGLAFRRRRFRPGLAARAPPSLSLA